MPAQVVKIPLKGYANFIYGGAAILAGFLYGSRWIWELSEGILKNKSYPPTPVTQYFFIVQLLFILSLAGMQSIAAPDGTAKKWLRVASLGLLWIAAGRTLEAFGAPGPWGFYSSPGVVATLAGLFLAGKSLMKDKFTSSFGNLLVLISLLHFGASALSILLFNVFGRDDDANLIASVVGNLLFALEGLIWIALGCNFLLKGRESS